MSPPPTGRVLIPSRIRLLPLAAAAGRTAALIATLVIAGCGKEPAKSPPAGPPPSVTVTPVARASINPRIEHVGQTRAVDTVDLRARVQGTLVKRAFKEGDDVREGALLFALERDPFEAAVDAAKAQVAQARADVPRAQRDLERARTLNTQGNLSQQALDRALSDQQQAEATVRMHEAALRQAQIDLGYTLITAPFDGRIGRSTYSPGQWVGPDSGVLATLVKIDPIYVVFNVSERDYVTYRQGIAEQGPGGHPKLAYIPWLRLSNGSEYAHPGRLNFVDNQVDSATGTIAVRAEFPNPEKLLVPGLFVTVLLEKADSKPALLIPQSSVQEDQAGRFVLVVTPENKVEARRVEMGARIGAQWEVVSGLNEGEPVIYEGIQKARPGAVVAPVVRAPVSPTGSPPGGPPAHPAG